MSRPGYSEMLSLAIAEARQGLAEGGIPIGAAIFDQNGRVLSAGRNRRVQQAGRSFVARRD